MERHFYPIGQGAFYAEKFGGFTIVYDCGSGSIPSAPDPAIKVVEDAFESGETINILFISHFHSDHINAVPRLIQRCNIERVVLPLIENKAFLVALYTMMGSEQHSSVISLLENPELFFNGDSGKHETKITQIRPIEGPTPYSFNKQEPFSVAHLPDLEPVDYKNLGNVINCGIRIQSGASLDWYYIPVNYNQGNFENEFRNIMGKDPFWRTFDFTDPKNIQSVLIDPERVKQLKKVYSDSFKEKINLSSMLVYSGPDNPYVWTVSNVKYGSLDKTVDEELANKPACIFSGDTDFNVMHIKSLFSTFIDNVGTIQVPHHGSKHNHNILQYPQNVVCPISTSENRYGHPSPQLIGDIMQNRSFPFCVTDQPNQELIETIDPLSNTRRTNSGTELERN